MSQNDFTNKPPVQMHEYTMLKAAQTCPPGGAWVEVPVLSADPFWETLGVDQASFYHGLKNTDLKFIFLATRDQQRSWSAERTQRFIKNKIFHLQKSAFKFNLEAVGLSAPILWLKVTWNHF